MFFQGAKEDGRLLNGLTLALEIQVTYNWLYIMYIGLILQKNSQE